MTVGPVTLVQEEAAAVAEVAVLLEQVAVELAYLDRVAMVLLVVILAHLQGLVEEEVQVVLLDLRIPVKVAELGAFMVPEAVVGETMLDTPMEVMEPSELFGLVLHVHSHLQTRAIYKWNFLFALKMVSHLNIQSQKTIFVRLFRR